MYASLLFLDYVFLLNSQHLHQELLIPWNLLQKLNLLCLQDAPHFQRTLVQWERFVLWMIVILVVSLQNPAPWEWNVSLKNQRILILGMFYISKQCTVILKDYWAKKKFARHGTFTNQFYIHKGTTFWKNQNFLTRAFFSTDWFVVLPYKAKCHLWGKISKGNTFLSDRIL